MVVVVFGLCFWVYNGNVIGVDKCVFLVFYFDNWFLFVLNEIVIIDIFFMIFGKDVWFVFFFSGWNVVEKVVFF